MGKYDGPHFEVEGENVVSVWAAIVPFDDIPDDYWSYDSSDDDDAPWSRFTSDFGFGYYGDDSVESYYDEAGRGVVPIGGLIEPLSYASSFLKPVTSRAGDLGVEKTSYVFLMYDFKYDPAVTGVKESTFLRFIGVFPYRTDSD